MRWGAIIRKFSNPTKDRWEQFRDRNPPIANVFSTVSPLRCTNCGLLLNPALYSAVESDGFETVIPTFHGG